MLNTLFLEISNLFMNTVLPFLNDAVDVAAAGPGAIKFIGAGIAVFTGIGAGIGQGMAAAKACEAVGRNPEADSKVLKQLIVGAGITESCAIYGLVTAILIIFVG